MTDEEFKPLDNYICNLIYHGEEGTSCLVEAIRVEDVKEFIKLLKKKIQSYRTATYNMGLLRNFENYLDELSGGLGR